MKHTKGYISRTLSFLGCICVAGLGLFLLKEFSTNPSSDRGNRKLSVKEFCAGVVQPFSSAIENQYGEGIALLDFFTHNEPEEIREEMNEDDGDDGDDDNYYKEGTGIIIRDDSSTELNETWSEIEESESARFWTDCTKSDYKEFSFPTGGLLYWYEFRYVFHAYTQCRGNMGEYGSAHRKSTYPYTWPQDTEISIGKDNWKYVHVSCCSDRGICENIKNDFNYDSDCWDPINLDLNRYSWWYIRNIQYRLLDPFLCTETRSFSFDLTQDGLALSTGEHSNILEEYVWCSSYYSEDDQPVFVVEKDLELSVLNVTCTACNETSTLNSCLDMKTNFLTDTLCAEESNAFYYSDYAILVPDVEACALEDVSSYIETLTLPAIYFPSTSGSEILGELNRFLECRLSAGVYTDLTSEDFPTFEIEGLTWSTPGSDDYFSTNKPVGLISVICKDKCSNGVICEDIDLQFNNELQCITKHECNRGWYDALFLDYDMKFLDGSSYEGDSRAYNKEVEMKMEKNLNDYIACRFGFGDDESFRGWQYIIYGWIRGNKFYGICFNLCGRIPYCDAIRVRRSLDPKDDKCYKKEISVDESLENSKVVTTYEYNFDYDGGETFQYNVQSLEENPLVREYFGDGGYDESDDIDQTVYDNQNKRVKSLMEDLGYEGDNKIAENKYTDLCQTLEDYVKCDISKTVVKIDVERQDEGDFKIDKIKEGFNLTLNELILGANLPRNTNFSSDFFELTKLATLTLRARGKLKGNLHSSIGNMTSLINLDLNQCPIVSDHQGLTGGIPTEIKNAPLEIIDLGCNKLSGSLPQEFFQHTLGQVDVWKRYNFINLNDNNFTGKLHDDLSRMTSLTQLSLARNKFTGAFPLTSGMKSLRLIDLQHNRIEKENVCTTGTAEEKGFTGNLPDILFTEGSRVEVAALNDNCFSEDITGKIRFSEHLQYLDLRNNTLRGILPRQLKQCSQLKVLLLKGNNLDLAATPNSVKRFIRDNQVEIDVDLGEVCDKNQRNTCIDD